VADAPLSPRNARVTAARRLLRSKGRADAERFLVEGPQAVREALTLGARPDGVVRELFVTAEGGRRHAGLVDAATVIGVRIDEIDDDVMAELAGTVNPQGVLAVCRRIDVPLDDVLARPLRLVAVLAQVRDPGNAGTVIRSSDAAGVDAVVLTEASVDVYNPKAVRASAGSVFHLPVVVEVPVDVAVERLRREGLRVLAADGQGDRDLDEEAKAGRLDLPTAWVFGNEAWGLPEEIRALCDAVVRVPIYGRAESLNLAAAAAVCLYASARGQRGTRQ
jgi:RNA methyltransferase, TrmH family